MLRPFVDLLVQILQLYSFCVIAWAILATLISFKVVNAYQPIVQKVMYALDRLCNPVLDKIRKVLPDLGGIDLSPIVLLLLLNFAQGILYTYFYHL
jgi:YggT family protein